MPEIYIEQQDGVALLGERDVRKLVAGLTILLPAGPALDPPGQRGASSLVQEYLPRGCAGLTGREFLNELDRLGVAFQFGGTMESSYVQTVCLPQHLPTVIRYLGRMMVRPTFPPLDFAGLRRQAWVAAMQREENPAKAVAARLQQACLGPGFGNPRKGDPADLAAITHDQIIEHYRRTYRRGAVVVSTVGHFDWEAVRVATQEAFGDLPAGEPLPRLTVDSQPGAFHYERESSQIHIGFGYPAPAYGSPAYHIARLACAALYEGMGSSLVQRVREQEGLAYRADAYMEASTSGGAVLGYVGTSAHRAQEALNVILSLLADLPAGISATALERARLRMKMLHVATGESCLGRSLSAALNFASSPDTWRVDDMLVRMDAISVDQVNEYLATQPARSLTVVTVGPQPLEVRW